MNPISVSVGHTVNCSLEYIDQNGNPMLTTPTPDAAPTWSDTDASSETLTAAPGGLTASALAIAAGSDVISVSLSVGGVAFSATLPVTVSAAPQVLTSVEIIADVV
jgi:hypothetical protein